MSEQSKQACIFVEGGGLQANIKERLIREAFVEGFKLGNGYHEDMWCTDSTWPDIASEEFEKWLDRR